MPDEQGGDHDPGRGVRAGRERALRPRGEESGGVKMEEKVEGADAQSEELSGRARSLMGDLEKSWSVCKRIVRCNLLNWYILVEML